MSSNRALRGSRRLNQRSWSERGLRWKPARSSRIENPGALYGIGIRALPLYACRASACRDSPVASSMKSRSASVGCCCAGDPFGSFDTAICALLDMTVGLVRGTWPCGGCVTLPPNRHTQTAQDCGEGRNQSRSVRGGTSSTAATDLPGVILPDARTCDSQLALLEPGWQAPLPRPPVSRGQPPANSLLMDELEREHLRQ